MEQGLNPKKIDQELELLQFEVSLNPDILKKLKQCEDMSRTQSKLSKIFTTPHNLRKYLATLYQLQQNIYHLMTNYLNDNQKLLEYVEEYTQIYTIVVGQKVLEQYPSIYSDFKERIDRCKQQSFNQALKLLGRQAKKFPKEKNSFAQTRDALLSYSGDLLQEMEKYFIRRVQFQININDENLWEVFILKKEKELLKQAIQMQLKQMIESVLPENLSGPITFYGDKDQIFAQKVRNYVIEVKQNVEVLEFQNTSLFENLKAEESIIKLSALIQLLYMSNSKQKVRESPVLQELIINFYKNANQLFEDLDLQSFLSLVCEPEKFDIKRLMLEDEVYKIYNSDKKLFFSIVLIFLTLRGNPATDLSIKAKIAFDICGVVIQFC